MGGSIFQQKKTKSFNLPKNVFLITATIVENHIVSRFLMHQHVVMINPLTISFEYCSQPNFYASPEYLEKKKQRMDEN
ncbi:hypothetical protein Hanom_Chr06g00505231 [Helianthus anomalus]